MCGIFFTTSFELGNFSQEKFNDAIKCLAHRGPDQEGAWHSQEKHVHFGHRRLSINDLSDAGRQPIISKDGRYVLVCNGEVYNYPILRQELESYGYQFFSNSDSEVLIYGYDHWGKDVLHHIQGMFAFVIWDNINNIFFAARDHVGMKPLFYTVNDKDITIASEVTAISKYHGKKDIHKKALAYYLSIGYVPAPFSICNDIHSLLPGHYIEGSKDKQFIKKYWSPPQPSATKNNIDPNYLQTEFETLFESIVKEHLLSDVPISLFLSGGLDSTAIAIALSRLNANVEALTINFPHAKRGEVEIAKMVAENLHLKHKIIDIDMSDIEGLAKKTAKAYDQPQGYSALMSMMRVCEEAAKDYKVAIGGDGGDEVFAGYNWYWQEKSWKEKIARYFFWLLPLLPKNNKYAEYIDKAHFASKSVLHEHAMKLFPRFLPKEISSILGIEFTDEDMLKPYTGHYNNTIEKTRSLQAVDLMNFCSDSILHKVDKASMHYALEVRAPFLDRRLIEWSFLQPEETLTLLQKKNLVKNYIHKYLPDYPIDAPKQGFSVPLNEWLNKKNLSEKIGITDIYQTKIENIEGKSKLWLLYFFSVWKIKHD